jgi:hypothetical protein
MAWEEEAQALEIVKEGPRNPCAIEMWLAPELGMMFGTVIGEVRRFPCR